VIMSVDAGGPVMSADTGDPVMSVDAGGTARCDLTCCHICGDISTCFCLCS
jgi:hypothetical protein